MTRPSVHEIGEALYGPLWQSPMARDLGVAVRTVQRWAAGDTEPATGVWDDLRRLMAARGKQLDGLVKRLAA